MKEVIYLLKEKLAFYGEGFNGLNGVIVLKKWKIKYEKIKNLKGKKEKGGNDLNENETYVRIGFNLFVIFVCG